MQFYNPTKTFIETKCVKNHKNDICKIGTRAFIVTGKSSQKNGSLQDICDVLDQASIPYTVFNDVEENPSTETVYKAAKLGIAFCADFVIGIGGGSPLDAAKAIAMMIKNPDKDEDVFYNKKEDLAFLPVITIPTTCGTGAEVTPNAVLTYHSQKKKGSMPYRSFPELALIDGKYISDAPRQLIINTSIDALAHAIESYLNTNSSSFNRMFSKYALESWKQCKEIINKETRTEEDNLHLMLTSTIAGMAISHTGTSLPHFFGYDLTYAGYASHGHACGLFLPSYLRTYEKHNPETVQDIMTLIGFKDTADFSSYIKANLPEVTITKTVVSSYIEKVSKATSKLQTYPYNIDTKSIEKMYADALTII